MPAEPLAHPLAQQVEEYPARTPSTSLRAEPLDPDLARVLAAWPTLPAAIRAGVLAMVKAATASSAR
jgi:hypothetical protein